ncbi:MAG: radical SAM/SPASM domain-containing protein [Aggregatilineales bacterium]
MFFPQRLKNAMNLRGTHLHSVPLLVLYLTDGCNSRCVSCNIWQNPRRNMPMTLADNLVNACAETGVKWVLLSGGEAMQHPEWHTIAGRFRQQGVHVMLLTNGLLLRKQIQQVVDNVDEVIVSLDGGTAATYDAIRGVDAFDLILEGIVELRTADIPVTTRSTIQRTNYGEIPQIIEAGLAADVTSISFLAVDVSNPVAFGTRFPEEDNRIPLINADTSLALTSEDTDILATILDDIEIQYAAEFASSQIAESPAKLRRILLQYFRALNGEDNFVRPRCNAPHFSTVIDVDGTLRPCYFLPSYGRLKPGGESLKTAVNVDAAQALREAYRTGLRPECATCVCPLHKSSRSLMRM